MREDQADFKSLPRLTVGECNVCKTGPLGLRTCGDCGAILIVCDECDAAWAEATLDRPPTTLGATTLPCPHCQSDLFEEPSHWTSIEEMTQCEWLADAAETDQLTIRLPANDDKQSDGD